MLDRVLGRAELKDRIEDLESEVRRLREEKRTAEERFEAERRRRSEATREKQEAEEELNRLEDRIAQLEGELDRRDGGDEDLAFRGSERLRGGATEEVLDRLESFRTEPEAALTAVVDRDEDLPPAVREAFGDRASLVGRAAPCVAVADDRGLVSAALSPPVLPDPGTAWADRFRLDREHFLPRGSHAVALVRADVFAIGEYRGTERLSFEGFTSEVKGDHSKGGFSQARFERLRDEQIEEHLDRCEDAISRADADRLYVVGDRAAIDELDVEADATAPVDATGSPEEALEDAVRSFWTTTLYRI